MTTTQRIDFIEGDKLQLMNTNCDNAASTWTPNDNLIVLTVQSDWCTETMPHSKNISLHQRYTTANRLAFVDTLMESLKGAD